jgi:3,4-dihydroxy-2-butanone 4-phosphate synthase
MSFVGFDKIADKLNRSSTISTKEKMTTIMSLIKKSRNFKTFVLVGRVGIVRIGKEEVVLGDGGESKSDRASSGV